MTVLVVEDDVDMRESIAMALESHAIAVRCVEDGIEALEYLSSNPAPRVILLDLWMPRMDGAELCRRLADDPEHAKIPIIMLTATEKPDLRVEAFLRKPIDAATLIAAVSPFYKTA